MKTHNGKEIHFSTDNFNDLFSVIPDKKDHYLYNYPIRSYMAIKNEGYSSINVLPSDKVAKFISERMIRTNAPVYFQAIYHDNGKVLLTCEYNDIIGSRYLAYVDAGTMPKTKD